MRGITLATIIAAIAACDNYTPPVKTTVDVQPTPDAAVAVDTRTKIDDAAPTLEVNAVLDTMPIVPSVEISLDDTPPKDIQSNVAVKPGQKKVWLGRVSVMNNSGQETRADGINLRCNSQPQTPGLIGVYWKNCRLTDWSIIGSDSYMRPMEDGSNDISLGISADLDLTKPLYINLYCDRTENSPQTETKVWFEITATGPSPISAVYGASTPPISYCMTNSPPRVYAIMPGA